MSPKKPNSANRKVARIKINKKQQYTCAIPGEGHSLQQYAVLLVQGGKFKDLPGVRLRAIRGKYDLLSVLNRKTSRSLYGVKRNK
jgi:small subunit ribosomal protein S12